MTIHFRCERCGHPIEVDDHFAGQRGHCKHCGHAEVVPAPEHPAHPEVPEAPLRLRPIEPHDSHPARHLEAHLATATAPREPALGEPSDPYPVLGTDELTRPVRPPNTHGHPIVRFVLNAARSIRNWLYVGSVLSLAVATVGFFLKLKLTLHIGIILVVLTNVGMLAVGLFYLVLFPFKEGLAYGLANLLFPPYAIYYWVTRWPKMKGPVRHTLASFTPILLAIVALLVYEEGPVLEKRVETALPALENAIEEKSADLERSVEGQIPAAEGEGQGAGGRREAEGPAPK